MNIRIISGCQNGADIAALKAAKNLDLPTGGMMPKGFKTLDGPRPEYAELYGVEEHPSDKYPPRTYCNVKNSAITIRFAIDFFSAGEVCTLNAINQYKKDHLDVKIDPNSTSPSQHSLKRVADFIYSSLKDLPEEERIVNVAGNSNKTYSKMEELVYSFMTEVLRIIKDK